MSGLPLPGGLGSLPPSVQGVPDVTSLLKALGNNPAGNLPVPPPPPLADVPASLMPSALGPMGGLGPAPVPLGLANLGGAGSGLPPSMPTLPAPPQGLPLPGAPSPSKANLLAALSTLGGGSVPEPTPLGNNPMSSLLSKLLNPEAASTAPTPNQGTAMANLASVLDGLKSTAAAAPVASPELPPEPAHLKPLPENDVNIVEKVVLESHRRSRTKAQLMREYSGHKRPEQNAVYVVLKAPSHDMVHLSVETGLWCVPADVEETLSQAYNQHSCVVLVFAVANTDHFLGYAYMSTQIKHRSEHPASMQPDLDQLPSGWHKPFRVSWVRIGSVSFDDSKDILNTDDGGRSVTQSQNGQVLSAGAGGDICNYIDAASVPVALKVGVSRHSIANKSKVNKTRLDVTDMTFNQYVMSVLTKRKQRLHRAARMQRTMGMKACITVPAPPSLNTALPTNLPVPLPMAGLSQGSLPPPPAPAPSSLSSILSGNPALSSLLSNNSNVLLALSKPS